MFCTRRRTRLTFCLECTKCYLVKQCYRLQLSTLLYAKMHDVSWTMHFKVHTSQQVSTFSVSFAEIDKQHQHPCDRVKPR